MQYYSALHISVTYDRELREGNRYAFFLFLCVVSLGMVAGNGIPQQRKWEPKRCQVQENYLKLIKTTIKKPFYLLI